MHCFRLLDTLAGRKDPSGLNGDLLIDGHLQPKNFKCMTGYVVQVKKYCPVSHGCHCKSQCF